MKIKVVVVDLELSARAKRIAAAVAVPLLILGGGAAAYASVPHTWKDGEVLKAEDLNANFSTLNKNFADVEQRATALEKKTLKCVTRDGLKVKGGLFSEGSVAQCNSGETMTGGVCEPYSGRGVPIGHADVTPTFRTATSPVRSREPATIRTIRFSLGRYAVKRNECIPAAP